MTLDLLCVTSLHSPCTLYLLYILVPHRRTFHDEPSTPSDLYVTLLV